MIRTIAAAVIAVLALAAYGATSHPKPKPSSTQSTAAARSFTDGDKYCNTIALRGQSLAEALANCKVAAVEQMPSGDVASSWISGCALRSL